MNGTLLIEDGTLEDFLDVLLINEDDASKREFLFKINDWLGRRWRWILRLHYAKTLHHWYDRF